MMDDSKHILVVDNDGDVQGVVVEILQSSGYRVSLADGGVSMRAFIEVPDPIDAIVLDASMPGEANADLIEHIRERGIKLVMISGSIEQIKAAEEKADQLLRKPFRTADLLRAVEIALASGTPGRRSADAKES
ncbi:MAG TPA: response regulator [Stellaceae bacterium]|jgi:CheY-like chemotaxis protein|nr:response regulator [Stellaceae bacterium]